MSVRRYVSTGRDVRSRTAAGEVAWEAPGPDGPGRPIRPGGPILELRSADGLLDDLGERIFVAEVAGEAAPEGDGAEAAPVLRVASARLVATTPWGDAIAARFALECAAHALGDQGSVALPHGRTLEGVMADAREALERSTPPEGALGFLARAATVRRLVRHGAAVSDLAMLAAKEDGQAGIDLVEDPAWTRLAAISDAVLASVEALRYLARPEYVGRREEAVERDAAERGAGAAVASDVQVEETPWGWVAIGADRVPTYVPAAACAEQAAERARQAVAEVAGPEAEQVERAWQAELLDALLSPPGTAS